MSRLKRDLKETQRSLRENVAVIEESNKKLYEERLESERNARAAEREEINKKHE